MKIETERALAIDAYIATHKDAEVAKLPIVIGGERKTLQVYRLPTNLLRYNIGNGRFTIEKLVLEKELGRGLNYDDPEDSQRIRKMLVEQDSELTEKAKSLKEDLKRVGQLESGVITHDGYVINGNRRMAVLDLLDNEEPTGKWKTLDVQRLPPNVSGQDLWRIEAGLQLSKEKKEEYGPMNELLKIKEGKSQGLSNAEIAAAMFEWTATEVEEALERLDLIDLFLDYVGQTEKAGYGFIQKFGLHEFFIDLQNNVVRPSKKAGLSRKDRTLRLNYAFNLIWASTKLSDGKKGERITHWDVRDLKKVYDDHEATALFVKRLQKVTNPQAIKPEDIRDDYKDARELIEFKRDSQQPKRLIETATRALKNIDHKSEFFKQDQVKVAFKELDSVVVSLKKALGL